MPDMGLTSRLIDSRKLVEETTRMVRQFMVDLHPPILDDYGLVPALKWYSNQFSSRTEIPVQVTASEDIPNLPKKTELILFRIVQEILNNVAKHAQASQVEISLENSPGEWILRVRDNGIGFDPAAAAPDQLAHWGLIHINQMAASIGGKLEIISAKSTGTQILVRLPRGQNEH
jgi:signal transduction histidine kinase